MLVQLVYEVKTRDILETRYYQAEIGLVVRLNIYLMAEINGDLYI